MKSKQQIPIHDIGLEFAVNVERISYRNPYDYHKIHRHSYFEMLFFVQGGGDQLIDFESSAIEDFSCYFIKPRQIHLVKRLENADGYLVQFTHEALNTVLLKDLDMLAYHKSNKVIYENDEVLSAKMLQWVFMIQEIQQQSNPHAHAMSKHLLATLLYDLDSCLKSQQQTPAILSKTAVAFTELVDEKLNAWSVNEYADALRVSTKKLTELVKESFGITPLKFIHKALLLEIKRDLVFKETNIKEVAYHYNFDSPSNFSLFVKKQTGYSPSELQKILAKQ
jgi:AraC-like DNA-binding protein